MATLGKSCKVISGLSLTGHTFPRQTAIAERLFFFPHLPNFHKNCKSNFHKSNNNNLKYCWCSDV